MNAHSHDYPNEPGHRGIDTSISAAQSIELSVGHLQRIALRAIRRAGARGLTTNELVSRVAIHRDSIQPRTSELRERGLIRDSGARRRNPNGINAIVWVAGGGMKHSNRKTAIILPFPGVDPTKIRPRPTCIADLPKGAKALVVIAHRGGFTVVIRPAVTQAEHFARQSFASARSAFEFARRTAANAPRRFQLILDETGRRSLDEILGLGPDPMGLGGAA